MLLASLNNQRRFDSPLKPIDIGERPIGSSLTDAAGWDKSCSEKHDAATGQTSERWPGTRNQPDLAGDFGRTGYRNPESQSH